MSEKQIPYVLATDATDQAMVMMINRNKAIQKANELGTRQALQERESELRQSPVQGNVKKALGKVRAYVHGRILKSFLSSKT